MTRNPMYTADMASQLDYVRSSQCQEWSKREQTSYVDTDVPNDPQPWCWGCIEGTVLNG